MNERRQSGSPPGPHPDADHLAALMEGALSKQDRDQGLAHLAECPECRRIAFLAQSAVPAAPAKQPRGVPWRRWMAPVVLAGAAAACTLLVVHWSRPHPARPSASTEIAVSPSPTASVVPSPAPVPARAAPHGLPASQRPAQAAPRPGRPAPPPAAGAAPVLTPPPRTVIGSLAPNAPQPASPRPETALATSKPESAATARKAPVSPATTQFAAHSAAPAGPLQGATAPPAPPQTAAVGLAESRPPAGIVNRSEALTVSIEQGQGPQNGFSAVSGMVTDPTGAVVAGATITLRGNSGAATQSATSGADGRFTIAAVPPGEYDLRVVAPGFAAASHSLDLHARDLALLTSALRPGAASETVEVNAQNAVLTSTPPASSRTIAPIAPGLPGKPPMIATVSAADRVLIVDAGGALFLSRDAGRRWKRIKPVWPGTVVQLLLAAQPASGASAAQQTAAKALPVFIITTSTGAVWVSHDGAHWRPR
jgi:hypothetical protein